MSAYVTAKADRLLAAGSVTVTWRGLDRVVARVHGDSGTMWTVTVDGDPDDPRARWWCTCPAGAHKVSCSHVRCVRLVTAEEEVRRELAG